MALNVNDPNAPKTARGSLAARIKRRLFRFSFTRSKLSTRNLDRLCRDFASTERTLVVHSEDVDHTPYFPNAFTVTKRPDVPADMSTSITAIFRKSRARAIRSSSALASSSISPTRSASWTNCAGSSSRAAS